MTAVSQCPKKTLSLLQLAEELGNVSKTCKIMGHHRHSLDEIRRAFQIGDTGALVKEKWGLGGPHPNRVSPEVEEAILKFSLNLLTHGSDRVLNELRRQGVNGGATGVRGVWSRHNLETRTKCPLRLEREVRDNAFALNAAQIGLFEGHSVDFRRRPVKSTQPGELLNQDTFYWGTLKGVGEVYT